MLLLLFSEVVFAVGVSVVVEEDLGVVDVIPPLEMGIKITSSLSMATEGAFAFAAAATDFVCSSFVVDETSSSLMLPRPPDLKEEVVADGEEGATTCASATAVLVF